MENFEIIKEIWDDFENTLKNSGEVSFWWRDDDIRAEKNNFKFRYIKYKYRTKKLMKLLAKYKIPAIFAVVPKNYEYGNYFTKILKKYNHYASIHGLNHVNNSKTNIPSEFPEGCNTEEEFEKIISANKYFEKIFQDRMLKLFVPPYNRMSGELKQKLIDKGFQVSESNFYTENKLNENVDYDFVNWSEFAFKPAETILEEIKAILKSGRKVIGLNNHHQRVKTNEYKFLNKFFDVIDKCENAKWIIPFDVK